MNLFTKSFQDVTFEDVVESCDEGTIENAVLDYKAVVPRDLSKHFATFSNTHGGLIIIGVEEDESTGRPSKYEGIVYDAKDIDRIHQFAAQVSPFPRYQVKLTNEVGGKVFVLIKIYEGDQPPYMSNSDSSIKIRTGNVTTPLRGIDSHELNRLYEKRNKAFEQRGVAIAISTKLRDTSLKIAQNEWEVARQNQENFLSTYNVGTNVSNLRVSVMPVSPAEPIIYYRRIVSDVEKYRARSKYLGEFPAINLHTVPGGAIHADWHKGDSSFSYGYINENGLIDSIDDVLRHDEATGVRNVYMNSIVEYIVRQLNVARDFYNNADFFGPIKYIITVDNILHTMPYPVVPDGVYHSPTRRSKVNRIDSAEWEIDDIDTVILNDTALLTNKVVELVKRIYWDFGLIYNDEINIRKYLQELGWSQMLEDESDGE